MKIRGLTPIFALGAAVSLAACSNGQHAAEVTAPPPAPAPAPVAPPAPMASSASQNQMSHSLVRQVQTALKQGHMYRGHVDGMWGPMTMRGVREYQRSHSLPTTGHLDDATLQSMNLQPAMSGGSGMNNTSDQGSMNNGSTDQGSMDQGSMNNGSMNNGSMNNGSMGQGSSNGAMNQSGMQGSSNATDMNSPPPPAAAKP